MLIKGKQYSQILFVHIPKTAGSSISKVLNDNNLDNWSRAWPRHHDPYSYLKDVNKIDDSVFSFSVVRNPYTRTYSCYRQYNKVNKTELSLIEYLNNIKQNKVSPISPLLHIPQSFYIMDNDRVQVDRVYKFEALGELEKELGWELGFYNVGNYVVESYIQDYSDEAIKMVQDFYSSDFINFGYSKDFNQTLEAK
jgi:Sulfotransferase family